jgi:hypothetical protein
MDARLELDQFYDWVSRMGDGVREMEEKLERIRAWGVASICWQTKLQKLHSELHKLRLDVTRCIAAREANRPGSIFPEQTAEAASAQRLDCPKVIPFLRPVSHRSARRLSR